MKNINFSFPENSNNYIDIIEDNLNNCPENIRKKILICSTELIQNNIVHNQKMLDDLCFSIKFEKTNDKILVECSQKIERLSLEKIIKKIDFVNAKSIEELKEIYKKNIRENDCNAVGNGLITCKLKTKNNILYKKNDESGKQNIVILNIILTFEL